MERAQEVQIVNEATMLWQHSESTHSVSILIIWSLFCHCLTDVSYGVEHRYTMGWVFPHHTHTRTHCNLLQVVAVPYCNLYGVKQNLQSPLCLACSFILLNSIYKFTHEYIQLSKKEN